MYPAPDWKTFALRKCSITPRFLARVSKVPSNLRSTKALVLRLPSRQIPLCSLSVYTFSIRSFSVCYCRISLSIPPPRDGILPSIKIAFRSGTPPLRCHQSCLSRVYKSFSLGYDNNSLSIKMNTGGRKMYGRPAYSYISQRTFKTTFALMYRNVGLKCSILCLNIFII